MGGARLITGFLSVMPTCTAQGFNSVMAGYSKQAPGCRQHKLLLALASTKLFARVHNWERTTNAGQALSFFRVPNS